MPDLLLSSLRMVFPAVLNRKPVVTGGGLCRLALDLALADEPERQDRAGEAHVGAEGQDVVEAGEEALAAGVDDHVSQGRGNAVGDLLQGAGGGGFDQLARV